jgi:glycosyltransferase involved in cell wall biosynthesis
MEVLEPVVSIVMPAFNSSATIKQSINSVLEQTYAQWELIIVDDCSCDSTVSIIREMSKQDERIRLIELGKNSGAGSARNHAIEQSKGRYIAFLDSDDLWHPKKLEKQIGFMTRSGEPFTYTRYEVQTRDGNPKELFPPHYATYSSILRTNHIGCLTAVYDTSYFGKMYMPTLRKRQDMALWLSLLKKTERAVLVDECLATYRNDTGMTQNKLKAAQAQYHLYRNHLNLPFLKSCFYMATYTFNGILKHRK